MFSARTFIASVPGLFTLALLVGCGTEVSSTAPDTQALGGDEGCRCDNDDEGDDEREGRVTICHSTGSQNHPYEEITVSENALDAHARHHDGADIIPAPAEGCPGDENDGDDDDNHNEHDDDDDDSHGDDDCDDCDGDCDDCDDDGDHRGDDCDDCDDDGDHHSDDDCDDCDDDGDHHGDDDCDDCDDDGDHHGDDDCDDCADDCNGGDDCDGSDEDCDSSHDGGEGEGEGEGEAPQSCNEPDILCGDDCVFPLNDVYNCGACGVACTVEESCIAGSCI